jgi:subtilisin family serine protease
MRPKSSGPARATATVTGKEVALAAPGVDIISTTRDGKYLKGTGTSSATAIVVIAGRDGADR